MGLSLSRTESLITVYCGFCTALFFYFLGQLQPAHMRSAGGPSPEAGLVRHTGQYPESSFSGQTIRGIWIDRTSLPQNRAECARLTERLAQIGINAIFPESFSRTAAVCYPSTLAPNDESYYAGHDILGPLIEEAHRRNIKVHAWCWCMCVGTAYRPGPQVMRHPDWLAVNMDGLTVSGTGTFWLCPHNRRAMAYIRENLVELARRYPLDGINLDYIRVEENDKRPFCMCDKCRDAYFRFLDPGANAVWPPDPRDPVFLQWREGLLDGFVCDLAKSIRAVRPGCAVSACVLPLERRAKRLEGQNWVAWLTDGYLDFACALTYTNRQYRARRWMRVIARHRRQGLQLLPSVGLHLCRTRGRLAASMMDSLLRADLGGVMLFSLRDIPPAVEETLQTGRLPVGDELALLKNRFDPVAFGGPACAASYGFNLGR